MNSTEDIHQPEDGLSEVVQDLREKSIIIFDVKSLIVVILTRSVRLTYVGSDTNKEFKVRLGKLQLVTSFVADFRQFYESLSK